MATQPRVASVTVALNPEPQRLLEQLTALAGQVEDIILVDNGSAPSLKQQLAPVLLDGTVAGRLIWVVLPDNLGIAAALNAGIARAVELDAAFVMCMDHDSVPLAGCVTALRCALIELEQSGQRVAAVGPRICDRRDQHEAPFIKLGVWRHRHQYCSASVTSLDTDFLISSGCFSRLAIYLPTAVGPLDNALFIDSVDFEWCCRARARGFALYGVCAAALDHRLGDSRREILPGWSIIVHSPTRMYYMTRNRITLYARSYVPLRWKSKDVLRMLAKLTLTLLFLAPRGAYLSASLAGARDALRRRSGKRQQFNSRHNDDSRNS